MSTAKPWLAAFAAGACEIACNRLLNSDIIAPLSVAAPVARDILFVAANICPLLLVLFALKRGYLTRMDPWAAIVSCGLVIVGTLLVGLHAKTGSTAALCGGYVLWQLGSLWVALMYLLALCQLDNVRSAVLCICASVLVGTLGQRAVGLFPLPVHLILCAVLPCATFALSARPARDNLALLSAAGGLESVELSNPAAFVSPLNPAFLCLFVFNLVFGFSLALNCISGIPVDTSPSGVVAALLVGGVVIVSRRRSGFVDPLAALAALVVIAGLLCAIVSLFLPLGSTSNYILRSGSACFSIIHYLVIFGIGSRNRIGALRVAAWASFFTSLGTLVGTLSGHSVNRLVGTNDALAAGFLCAILISFVALAFLWLAKFSFHAVIFGVEPLTPVVAPIENGGARESIEDRCARLGTRHGLTKREVELCALLARGRNGRAISDQLTLSYNTVKTHVKHIYMKLDVHTQQELIDLVEDGLGRQEEDA